MNECDICEVSPRYTLPRVPHLLTAPGEASRVADNRGGITPTGQKSGYTRLVVGVG